RQLALDLRTLPRAIAGTPYDKYMSGRDWNAWIKDGGWEAHFPAEAVKSLYVGEDDQKMPAVIAPTTGEGRDLLIRDLNFILPWGLFVIGLKFLLRIVLVLTGHVKIDPDAAHDDEDMTHAHDHDAEVAAS